MSLHDLSEIWKRLAALSAEALRMGEEEALRFTSNKVARLIGLLPFVAGCEEAERTALAHLATYVIAGRGGARESFDHKPADDRDPLARLETISHFAGGDQRVLEAGLRRLALCMVAGYRRDMEKDKAAGAYNPLVAGTWEGKNVVERLSNAMSGLSRTDGGSTAYASAEIDSILSVESAGQAIWQN